MRGPGANADVERCGLRKIAFLKTVFHFARIRSRGCRTIDLREGGCVGQERMLTWSAVD